MRPSTKLSEHCVTNHLWPVALPPARVVAKWLLKMPMVSIDPRTHFSGLRGAGWRLFGVTRSHMNPNICTL